MRRKSTLIIILTATLALAVLPKPTLSAPTATISVLPGLLTIRPNAAGTTTQWTPSAGANWQCVDESVQNGDTDYVYTATAAYVDSYNLQDHTTETWSIQKVRVVMYAKTYGDDKVRPLINVYQAGSYYLYEGTLGPSESFISNYTMYYSDWATNPKTVAAWTWADIDLLQAGFKSYLVTSPMSEVRVTQIYVIIYGPASQPNIKNPPGNFTVSIEITNLPASPLGINAWELKLGFDDSIIDFDSAIEGTLLKGAWVAVPPPGRWTRSTYFAPPYEGPKYVQLGQLIQYNENRTGSGTLALVNFQVIDRGSTTLHLYDIKLLDSKGADVTTSILSATQDGSFYTTLPVAKFTYSPQQIHKGETVTFNATGSYDPDGGSITNMKFIWGDSTSDTILTTPPWITTHSYAAFGTYLVNLTVTDNEGETGTTLATIRISRDVWIVDIERTYIEVYPTYTTEKRLLNVTVKAGNKGTVNETFTVTLYYNSSATGWTQIGTPQTVTDLMPGAQTVPGLIFTWDIFGISPARGVYMFKAVASTVPDEVETSDNTFIMTWPLAPPYKGVRIKLPGDVTGDNFVDGSDLGILAAAWFKGPGATGYDERADFNGDNFVDGSDLGLLAAYWFQGIP